MLLGVAATSCEFPAFTPVFTVNSAAALPDIDPGDGICEATPGADDCTIPAAIDEANTTAQAEIRFPTGADLTGTTLPAITGHVKIVMALRAQGSAGGLFGIHLRVAEGGILWMDGLTAARRGLSLSSTNFTVQVDGVLVAKRSYLISSVADGLTIGPTGNALFDESTISRISNEGTLSLRHSDVTDLDTSGAGSTQLRSSIVNGAEPACTGTLPTSFGYNLISDTSCGAHAAGDLEGTPFDLDFTSFFQELVAYPTMTSPAIDAIPFGVNGCGTDLTADASGTARPNDGNGDGVLGCDIGPGERPSSSS